MCRRLRVDHGSKEILHVGKIRKGISKEIGKKEWKQFEIFIREISNDCVLLIRHSFSQ